MHHPLCRTLLRVLLSSALIASALSTARAQTGVSDDRVSLPDGPGSAEGLGDNAESAGNMGLARYNVPFRIPAGFAEATPQLGLSYSSGSGNGLVGVGWSLPIPSIERMTLRGLPLYDADDELVADGGEQLVRVSEDPGAAQYRSRFEQSFARTTWHEPGPAGHFSVEYPDGSIGYFGATSGGDLVEDARLSDVAGNTFRYLIVDRVDRYGHRVHYEYASVDGVPYLVAVGYVHPGGASSSPRYEVQLHYEGRPDVPSDAKPGFVERTELRLSGVSITVSGEVIRSYALLYEADAAAGWVSRLSSVEERGRDGRLHPRVFTFGYSRALQADCTAGPCDRPFVVDMGQLPVAASLRTGDATLVDINGDSLPDVVDSSRQGAAHRFVYTRLSAEGIAEFDPTPRDSALATRSDFSIADGRVQVMDLNGDGLADMVNNASNAVLCNDGSGDWTSEGCVASGDLGVGFDADAGGEGNPQGVRFLDVNNDRRIDLLITAGVSSTLVKLNTPAGFVDADATALGAIFDVDQLLLADMNGDGLLDPVELGDRGQVYTRTHVGHGRWSGDWRLLAGPLLEDDLSHRPWLTLEDINGDGLDDLVLVAGTQVKYSLNRNGEAFDPYITLTSADVDGDLPTRANQTTVLFADMNANGTRDVVWIDESGRFRYLELFTAPPNLLSRIENGLGMVQELTYGTALLQRVEDPAEWTHHMPQAMNVVVRDDRWTTLSGGDAGEGLHEVTLYSYADGFYDGVEKTFRGFRLIDAEVLPDSALDSQEGGRSERVFEIGDVDPHRSGLLAVERHFGADDRPLYEAHREYSDCDVDGVPSSGLLFDVRHLCLTAETTVRQEGAAPVDWVTLRTTYAHDGFGQTVREARLGVEHRGGLDAPVDCGACVRSPDGFGEACGAGCEGDEFIVETTYITPGSATGDRWILGRAASERRFGRADLEVAEKRIYYDGEPFVGMALGTLDRGDPSRVTSRVIAGVDDWVASERREFDAHGNAIVEIDPEGSARDEATHRRSYTYGASGLQLVRTDLHLQTLEGDPYRLRREYSYDAAFDEIVEATAWMVVLGGAVETPRNTTAYRYDSFGQRVAILLPGDPADTPSNTMEWRLGDPISSIHIRSRSEWGGEADLERVRCVDGRGRAFQSRARIEGESYQVVGHTIFNARGRPVRIYQPYVATGSDCDSTPPGDVRFESIRYDVMGRVLRRTLPDVDAAGGPSVIQFRYGPLSVASFDAEDSAAGGLHEATPTLTRQDGLGRLVEVERSLADAGAPAITRVEYDGLGRVQLLVDPSGSERRQVHDLLGRLIEIEDSSAGLISIEYDDADNPVARVDGRGRRLQTAFDGANRPTLQWEDGRREETETRIRYDFGGACDPSVCTNVAGKAFETIYPLPEALTERFGGAPGPGVDLRGYDSRGMLVHESRTVGGLPLRTRHLRDNVGRELAVIHPDLRRVDRRLDGTARTVEIDGIVDELLYSGRGLPVVIRHANGAVDQFEFDSMMRLGTLRTLGGDGAALQDTTYRRDRVGNIVELSDSSMPPAGWSALDVRFEYDALYRAVRAEITRDGGVEELSWVLDASDNLLSALSSEGATSSAHAGELAYDPERPNTLVAVGSGIYEHDEAGHLTERDGQQLEWDHLGRLVRIARGDETLAEFVYGLGMARVATLEGGSLTVHASSDFEIRDATGVMYARLGDRRIFREASAALSTVILSDVAPEGSADGLITAGDAWLAHASRAGIASSIRVASEPADYLRATARRMLIDAGDESVSLHADHLGNLSVATDGEGNERGRRRYSMPWGEDRTSGHVDAYGPFGQEESGVSGLHRFAYRWLDPISRRWTSSDPAFTAVRGLSAERAGEAGNLYAYVGNNFVNATDPTGLAKTFTGPFGHLRNAIRRRNQARRNQRLRRTEARIAARIAGVNPTGCRTNCVPVARAVVERLSGHNEEGVAPESGIQDARTLESPGAEFHHVAGTGQEALATIAAQIPEGRLAYINSASLNLGGGGGPGHVTVAYRPAGSRDVFVVNGQSGEVRHTESVPPAWLPGALTFRLLVPPVGGNQ